MAARSMIAIHTAYRPTMVTPLFLTAMGMASRGAPVAAVHWRVRARGLNLRRCLWVSNIGQPYQASATFNIEQTTHSRSASVANVLRGLGVGGHLGVQLLRD